MSDSLVQRARPSSLGSAFDPKAQPWQRADSGLLRLNPRSLTPDALRDALRLERAWSLDPLTTLDTQRQWDNQRAPVLAAVLIPMMMRASGVSVMLTQRAAHLHDHAGQISFPGGRVERSDATPVAAALREAQEETGLPQDRVEVLGSMPDYVTTTGFLITPVLSLVRPDFTLAADAFEVAEIFEVPLDFLMDPANHRLYEAQLSDGRRRHYYAIPWGEHFIWGATAGMLRNLYQSLARTVLR